MNVVPRFLLGLYGALLLALALGGSWFYRTQERQVRAGAAEDLQRIARSKVDQIVQWRAERLGDAAVLMGSPLFGEAVLRLLSDPGSGDAERIMAHFRTMQVHYPYRDIVLLDGHGRVVLSPAGKRGELAAPVLRALEAAMLSAQPMVSDLYQEAGSAKPGAMVVAPLRVGAAPGTPFAIVLLPVDVQDFLYPVTQTWPTTTRSGETLFVRREGDDVLFLNPLRHDAQAAFNLRIPLAQRGVPAVEAVWGARGVVEGRDYTGAPVLAALAAVPDSPWFIVTKIDTEEALEDWRSRAKLIVAVLVLLAAALGSLIGMVWLQRGKYRTLLEAAAALGEREARLRDAPELNEKLLGAATAGIAVFKASGRCVMANATAARIVGGTVEALRQQDFRRIPSWQESGLLAGAERTLATRQAQQLEIALRTSYGCDLWLDCSLSPFEAGGEPHLLLIFHDVTRSKEAEALKGQLSQIIESTSDFVATASPAGQIRYFNRTARLLFGLGDGDDPGTYSIGKSHPAWAAKRVLEEGIPAAIRDGTWTGETAFVAHDGREIPHTQVIVAHRGPDGSVAMISTIARDISQRKKDEELLQARLRLLEAGPRASLKGFLQLALDEIERRTGSTIGFYHFMDADQETLTLQAWSTNTVRHMCTAEGQGQHYPVSKAGVWVDCVRERRPVIHNDYAALAHKRGLPAGHAPILRQLVVPILRGDQIVAIIGVGNKPTGYDQADVELATLLGDFSWEVVERKRAEEALVVSQQRLQLAVETAEIGIWDWDIGRNTIEWDAQMHRFYGLQPRADRRIDFQQWADLVLPEDLPEQLRILQGIARHGGRSEREFRMRRADDGRIRHMQAAEVCVTDLDGRPVHVVGVNLDITTRKMEEQALAQEAERRRVLFEQSQDGIVVLDLAGEVVELNRAFADMLGYSLEEAQRLRVWDWDDQMSKAELLARLVAVAEVGATFETRHRRKNGLLLDVEVSSGGVDWRGRTLVFAVHRDISLRKIMETRQRRLLEELSRSNTDLEQFAYVASHDLKSPLRAIDSLAGWLQEDLESVLTGDSRKHLDLLRQRAHRMERLLDDLLAYSRAGRVPADIVAVDVARLVGEIGEMIHIPAGFTVRLNPPAPVFATAVTPLRQVLTNLIANAIKHHDRAAGVIEIAVAEAGEWFEFTVADDGPGIPPEFHERIFGMFQTLRPRDEVEGSGIGLALVRRIVARYGGKATVACREPRGSIFRFQWPKTISTDESPSA